MTKMKKKTKKKIKRYPLNQSVFFKLTTKRRLAEILDMTPSDLRRFINEIRYNEFFETNEKGKKRLIESPTRKLKIVQRYIARQLSRIETNESLQCPVKGRSYVSNAQVHAGAKVIRTLDIKKYFPTSTDKRVYWFWHKVMLCNADVAAVLTKLSTYKGHLPTGSPLSPILAYFAHLDMWEQIETLARQYNCRVTIYIDDLTISGNLVPGELVWQIKKEIKRIGLDYHKEKNFWNGTGEVTGVIIKDSELLLPRRQLLKIHRQRKALRKSSNQKQFLKIQRKLKGLHEQAKQITAA